jgi:hypothetical protein
MRAFFRGITETIPSLFRGIFSERNSVPNPRGDGERKPHSEEGGKKFMNKLTTSATEVKW